MRVVKIEAGMLPAGGGAVLLMSAAQVERRRHNIARSEACGDVLLAEARVPLQFKTGEIVGIDSVPKYMADKVRDATPDDGDVAKAMIAAAAMLGEPAAQPAVAEKPAPRRR